LDEKTRSLEEATLLATRRVSSVGLVIVMGLMAACGSSAPSAELTKLLSDAVHTTGSTSSRVSMDMTVEIPDRSRKATISMSGAIDETTGTGELNMEVSGGSTTKALQMRLLGSDVYLRLPGANVWQRFDASELSGQPGVDTSNPTTAIEYLRGVSDSITEQGTETVRGVRTRRLRAEIDLAKTAERLGGAARSRVQALSQLGVDTLPIDVWIDDQGHVRREFFTMDVSQGGQRVKVAMTMELFDFGVQVDVQPPPDDRVKEGDPAALGL
jgi:hypothetical protein